MEISKLEPRRPWEQVHPSRDPTELERIGDAAGLTHVGSIAQEIVEPLLRRHKLEVIRGGQLEREVVGFQIQWITRAAELAS